MADPRPAWLWSQDGTSLLWQNLAAQTFADKVRRHRDRKSRLNAVPIRSQIPRLIRMGTQARASLSRMQFSVGTKPVSATCLCTPLTTPDDKATLLMVAVDPVSSNHIKHGHPDEMLGLPVFDGVEGFLLIGTDHKPRTGTKTALERQAKNQVIEEWPEEIVDGDKKLRVTTLRAGPGGLTIAVFLATKSGETQSNQSADDLAQGESTGLQNSPELSEIEQHEIGELEDSPPEAEPEPDQELEDRPDRSLSGLLDRLADDTELFGPLGEDQPSTTPDDGDDIAPDAEDPAPDDETSEPDDFEHAAATWRVTARTISPVPGEDDELQQLPLDATDETIERTSRYNFDELTRILIDRVGREPLSGASEDRRTDGEDHVTADSLVNLSDETLVLNRLPIGLIIFRDQQILFANRHLTEMLNYTSSASLRTAGLPAIFPSNADSREPLGPVTHLVSEKGDNVAVSTRLQSIAWQGKPAFLLSAHRELTALSSESAIREFASTIAIARNEGFIETSRAGIVESVSGRAAELFERTPEILIGRTLLLLTAREDGPNLQTFLDQPVRFAARMRPTKTIHGSNRALEIQLFAEGRAGMVTGYFGFVRSTGPREVRVPEPLQLSDTDPTLLARLSRSIRRPLNTIVGFSDLIASETFGPVGNRRYAEYARDIRLSGIEIKSLVDELDEFTRLREGRYEKALVEFALSELLEACAARVRVQAGAARVLVRTAISENLPVLRADQSSLAQAVLNLLASAIDQSPQGGQVVLSAQRMENGNVEIHVRDSAGRNADIADRFVVFRDEVDAEGRELRPVRSSVGLALTRSLLAVNECDLSIDPTTGAGTIFSLTIPGRLMIAS